MTSLPQRLHVAAQEVVLQHPHLSQDARKVVYQVIERLIVEAQCSWEQSVIDRCEGVARCGCATLCATCQMSLRIVMVVVEAASQDDQDADFHYYQADLPDPFPYAETRAA